MGLDKIFKFSSAPLNTKNSTNSGAVQPSTRLISSSEKSQMLQKMVPVIMHTSSRLKPKWMPPSSNSTMDSPTVSSTKPMEMDRRLLREWKNFSTQNSTPPATAPRARDSTISITGSTSTVTRLMEPLSSAVATPKEAENSTSPTASSMATTSSSSRVSGPSALYCRTTISVAAGAVAAAMAPRVMAEEMEISSGLMKCRATRAASTKAVVATAWRMPTAMACLPMCLSCSSRNALPMVKAIKPSATWEIISRWATASELVKPREVRCSAPRQ